MKFKLVIFCFLLFVFNIVFSADASSLQVSAKSAVLMCADSGQIIFEHNAYEKLPIASTTKIMTALVAVENLAMDQKIKVGNEVLDIEGTSLGLRPGDVLSAYDLLIGLMLSSGNDAAHAVAVAVGGSVADFILLMNEKAKEIGLRDSSFATVSGLDAEKHYSTAYDMALLTKAALKNDVFADIVSKYTATIRINDKKIWLKNHNRLLNSYDGMIGVKTGFTKKSGRCLVTAAVRGDYSLIAVTLNAPDDWADHKQLLDYGFSVVDSFYVEDVLPQYYVDVVGGMSDFVTCSPAHIPIYCGVCALSELETQVRLYSFAYAPVETGDVLGELVYLNGDSEIAKVPLLAKADVGMNYCEKQKTIRANNLFQLIYGWLSDG